MKSIKVTDRDLIDIFESAKKNFGSSSNNGLSAHEFVARCYLEACDVFLHQHGVELDLKFTADLRYLDGVHDDD